MGLACKTGTLPTESLPSLHKYLLFSTVTSLRWIKDVGKMPCRKQNKQDGRQVIQGEERSECSLSTEGRSRGQLKLESAPPFPGDLGRGTHKQIACQQRMWEEEGTRAALKYGEREGSMQILEAGEGWRVGGVGRAHFPEDQ